MRVNEDEVPRLPIFPAQWALDDPRQRPYLVVWGNANNWMSVRYTHAAEQTVRDALNELG